MNATFKDLNAKFWRQFEQGLEMALATSADGVVTNRVVMVAPCQERLYLLTAKESTKYPQMLKNPSVGLCAVLMQMTGAARPLGHPLDEANQQAAGAYKSVFEDYFNQFSASADYALVEITPARAVFYLETDAESRGYTIDFNTKTVGEL